MKKHSCIISILLILSVSVAGLAACADKDTEQTWENQPPETVTFTAGDGLTVTADHYQTTKKNAPYILLFHQAGASRGEYIEIAPRLNELGFNCLAVDQRVGDRINEVTNETNKRARELSLESAYTNALPDLQAALLYTKEELAAEKIIIWGSSYSSSLVFILGNEFPEDICAILSFSPGEYFEFEGKKVSDYAANIYCPVLVATESLEQSRSIYDSLPADTKILLKINIHGSSSLYANNTLSEDYWQQVSEFLQNIPVAALPARTAKPKQVATEDKALEYFYEISKIPRGSDNEQAISDYLVAFAKENGLPAVQDEARNVLITKPGSVGREDEPPVILQAHMDMVCEKNADSNHDFLTDPIIPIIEGDWIRADGGTTLGADNGGGLAMILAVLAADDLSHPPLEVVITANEDGGEGPGVYAFNIAQLKGKRMINLDSEVDGVLTISCTGNAFHQAIIREDYEATPTGSVAYQLTVKGLIGGHSAVDIDKGRANAIILMAAVLDALDDGTIYLTRIDGGTAENAIPRECLAVISFAESNLEKIRSVISQAETKLNTDYPNENIRLTLEKADTPQHIVSRDTLRKVVDVILTTPNGVQAMSGDFEGIVQTSSSMGIIFTYYDPSGGKGKVDIGVNKLIRSFAKEGMTTLLTEMNQKAQAAGVFQNNTDLGDPWEPKEDSPLRDKMAAVYTDIFGKAPIIAGIHGGLECAFFAEKIPDCDILAIGPTIENAHSPSERMSLSSFKKTCIYLVNVLEKL
ncbi:MAG: beta-Ala-His dipeptidase [Clostridiales bacterium]|jgi:dipeptidase D|nr:beta-Ala-His dipeptidase [Clostridiales bacterium]